MNETRLQDLYKTFYGYVAPPFPAAGIPDPKNFLPVKKLTGLFNRKSMLGTELRMPIKFNIPGKKFIQLPNEPIVSFDGATEVVITTLNRGKDKGKVRRGSVKEIVALEDYKIVIKGWAYNETEDEYPDEQMANIREIVEYPGAMDIVCHHLNKFGITRAVVMDKKFPRERQTAYREQPYEIYLMSDEDLELELI